MKKILGLMLVLSLLSLAIACQKEKTFSLTLPEGVTSNQKNNQKIARETSVTLTLTVPEGEIILKLLVNDQDVTDKIVENTYTFTMVENVKITYETGGDNVRRGTFNRPYPKYYQTGVPLVEDAHIVYINWDGFARYYLDEFLANPENANSTLKKLIDEGTFFENLHTTLPSITNPCQNMILSGGTSAITKNIYRYYDKKTNTVIQQLRENKADTIVTKAVEEDISIVSFSHFLALKYLKVDDPRALYVHADDENLKVVARGEKKKNDHFSRMEQAIKMFKGEEIVTSRDPLTTKITLTELPKIILIYADDPDGVGHNEAEKRGYPVVRSEVERRAKIQTLLKEMDQKLGELIQAAKDNGHYEKLVFFLTTDHGMSPFGHQHPSDDGGQLDYTSNKTPHIEYLLRQFDPNINFEFLAPDESPKPTTNVVGVGANLNLSLTFKKGISDEKLNELKMLLEKEDYVYKAMTRDELKEIAFDAKDIDIMISPADFCFFSRVHNASYLARGQHDSMLETSSHVVGYIWGKGIKKGYVYQDRAYIYDFGITMAAVIGMDLPKANGIVLDIFEREE